MDDDFSPGRGNGQGSIEELQARSHENFGEFTPTHMQLRNQASEGQGDRRFKGGKQSHGVKIRQELFTPQQQHTGWGYQHSMDYFGPRASHGVERGFKHQGKNYSG